MSMSFPLCAKCGKPLSSHMWKGADHRFVCPNCGIETVGVVLGYDPVWRDGKVFCEKCYTYLRTYDAG